MPTPLLSRKAVSPTGAKLVGVSFELLGVGHELSLVFFAKRG
jgi:hypothetical protein